MDWRPMIPGGTHIPMLLACLEHTAGPILEFGAGLFSTPMVALFAINGRYARTYENTQYWFDLVNNFDNSLKYVRELRGGQHEVRLVGDWDDSVVDDKDWSIVFLDHNPPQRRRVDAKRLRDRCQVMIAHDYGHPDCGFEEVFSTFVHIRMDERRSPATAVASDQPLDWLDGKGFD